MSQPDFVPYTDFVEYEEEEQAQRSVDFYKMLDRRRSIRAFSDRKVELSVLQNCIRAAGTAPSGAHMQPWHFVVVSNPDTKRKIRIAAEKEEQAFYSGRAPEPWLEALSKLGTDEHKPYLETAPYLVVLFAQNYGIDADGVRHKHYYVSESVGIAAGMFIAAVQYAGLATLTHTPSPMKFLSEILERPESERPYLLLPVGYPAQDVTVPDIERKPLTEIASYR
ncbi:MAG: nitroreductase family protein [Rhodothermales bacterium]|nr:nitroreductase family protein [Rhodothermales bacterium]